jgi:hypothetical protein
VKERLAATALAPGGSAAHHRMNRQARREKSTKKTDREEDPDSKKEEELSTRRAEENSTPRKPNFKPALLSDYHSAADTPSGVALRSYHCPICWLRCCFTFSAAPGLPASICSSC